MRWFLAFLEAEWRFAEKGHHESITCVCVFLVFGVGDCVLIHSKEEWRKMHESEWRFSKNDKEWEISDMSNHCESSTCRCVYPVLSTNHGAALSLLLSQSAIRLTLSTLFIILALAHATHMHWQNNIPMQRSVCYSRFTKPWHAPFWKK